MGVGGGAEDSGAVVFSTGSFSLTVASESFFSLDSSSGKLTNYQNQISNDLPGREYGNSLGIASILACFSSSETRVTNRLSRRIRFANAALFFDIQISIDLSLLDFFASLKISLLSAYLFNPFNEILRVKKPFFIRRYPLLICAAAMRSAFALC